MGCPAGRQCLPDCSVGILGWLLLWFPVTRFRVLRGGSVHFWSACVCRLPTPQIPPSFLERSLLHSETLAVCLCRHPLPESRAAAGRVGFPRGQPVCVPSAFQHDVETGLHQLFGFLITAPQKASGPWRMIPCSRALSAAPSPAAPPPRCVRTCLDGLWPSGRGTGRRLCKHRL